MDDILKLSGLTKSYGDVKVVDNVNITIKRGRIYGLIGPNGAGKTTIMKMIAGLAQPDGGTIELFGEKDNPEKSRKRTSFMIESPYIDGSMTARQNMEYIRYLRGVADIERIDEILEFVGLGNTGKKHAKNFSLGMRQRLGIGMALLPSPEMMILDEPVNGLDPEGIVDVRKMLTKLCMEDGITILISSHLLSELSELCTDFIIVSQGRVIESISKEQLEEKCRSYIAVRTDDVNALTTVIEQKLKIKEYMVVGDEEVRIPEGLEDIRNISKAITDAGLTILKLVCEGESLEDFYLSTVNVNENGKVNSRSNAGLLRFRRGKNE